MDFFEHQEQARRISKRLTGLVILAVLGVLATIHALVAVLIATADDTGKTALADALLDPGILSLTLGIGGLVILTGTLVKLHSLRTGGVAVAQSMGGTEILPDTTVFEERRLLNIVEEMALASGIRVPRVFVLRQEPGLNAFAAGHDPDDAAVAVTAGMLGALNRAELQAVIGHEFSHILNGDMRLNIRLIGVLGGILGLAVVGRVIMQLALRALQASSGRRSNRKDNNGGAIGLAFLLFGLAVWIIGSVGVFFGRLLQSAIARQREYLADASATQFTRDPAALAGALKIIGAAPHGARVAAGHATEVSHMLFASGLTSLFATHPPLVRRIQRLDPAFSGDFGPARESLRQRIEAQAMRAGQEDDDDARLWTRLSGLGLPTEPLQGEAPASVPPPLPVAAAAPFAGPASPSVPPPPIDAKASPGLAWLSRDERIALRRHEGALACLYGALLAAHPPDLRQRQLTAIAAAHGDRGEALSQTADIWWQRHRTRTARQKRMVCELAVQRLRDLPETTRAEIIAQIEALSRMDRQVDAFEFALGHLLRRRLLPEPAAVRQPPVRPERLTREASLILSLLTRSGQRNPQAVQAAWQAGTEGLIDPRTGASLFPGLQLLADGLNDLAAIESALEHLIRLAPVHKRELMNAGRRIVRQDARITDQEADTLAAIADAIHAHGWSPAHDAPPPL